MSVPDINELERITIRCPGCSKRMRVPRSEYDPIRAAYFTIPCPQCDDGDFHEPHYFDCDDREISCDDPHPSARDEQVAGDISRDDLKTPKRVAL